MGLKEYEYGLDERTARVVIAARQCVREAHRQKRMNPSLDIVHTRFIPVYQADLIEAVEDLVAFETGSGKYSRNTAPLSPDFHGDTAESQNRR